MDVDEYGLPYQKPYASGAYYLYINTLIDKLENWCEAQLSDASSSMYKLLVSSELGLQDKSILQREGLIALSNVEAQAADNLDRIAKLLKSDYPMSDFRYRSDLMDLRRRNLKKVYLRGLLDAVDDTVNVPLVFKLSNNELDEMIYSQHSATRNTHAGLGFIRDFANIGTNAWIENDATIGRTETIADTKTMAVDTVMGSFVAEYDGVVSIKITVSEVVYDDSDFSEPRIPGDSMPSAWLDTPAGPRHFEAVDHVHENFQFAGDENDIASKIIYASIALKKGDIIHVKTTKAFTNTLGGPRGIGAILYVTEATVDLSSDYDGAEDLISAFVGKSTLINFSPVNIPGVPELQRLFDRVQAYEKWKVGNDSKLTTLSTLILPQTGDDALYNAESEPVVGDVFSVSWWLKSYCTGGSPSALRTRFRKTVVRFKDIIRIAMTDCAYLDFLSS
jgi:hypothetical protein